MSENLANFIEYLSPDFLAKPVTYETFLQLRRKYIEFEITSLKCPPARELGRFRVEHGLFRAKLGKLTDKLNELSKCIKENESESDKESYKASDNIFLDTPKNPLIEKEIFTEHELREIATLKDITIRFPKKIMRP